MTEDVARFVPPPGDRDDNEQAPRLPRSPGWHLCDDDLSVIDDLHAVCVDWLAYARGAKTARDIAAMMACLEAIAAGQPVNTLAEVTVSRKRAGESGLGATIQLNPSGIELSTTEWVWVSPEQGHDHAFTVHAQLTRRGGFPHDDVDYWHHLTGFATDGADTWLWTSHEQLGGKNRGGERRMNERQQENDASRSSARDIAAGVSGLAKRVEQYEALIVHEARRQIEEREAAVLAVLARTPAMPDLSNDNWPFSHPLQEAGFVDHLAWAKHEGDFPLWREEFQKTVQHACRYVIDHVNWSSKGDFDLLLSATCIERGPAGLDAMLEWSADQLTDHVWHLLLMSDGSILADMQAQRREAARDESDMAYLLACHGAIVAWSDEQFDAMARRAIHGMQRRDAVGEFENEFRFRSLWDEYCHVVKEGLYRPSWHAACGAFCFGVVEECDAKTLWLLTIAAIEAECEEWSAHSAEGTWPSLVADVVIQRVNDVSHDRKLDRFRLGEW
jgi:hypothetical protein